MIDPHGLISGTKNEDLGCSSVRLAISELDSVLLIATK